MNKTLRHIDGRKMMWKQKIVSPEQILAKIDPGMSIFLGTGMAEPRTPVKHLTESNQTNLRDVEEAGQLFIGKGSGVLWSTMI